MIKKKEISQRLPHTNKSNATQFKVSLFSILTVPYSQIHRGSVKYYNDSVLRCPDSHQEIRVGTAGEKNLEIHRGSQTCKKHQERAEQEKKNKPQTLHNFL